MDAGRGTSDVTGEAADCGLLGYGRADQVSAGLHTRLFARAYAFRDDAGRSLLLIVCDLPLLLDSVYRAVLERLAAGHGRMYTAANVLVTATHTHCGPGGYAHHRLYNLTTHGFHPTTFGAIVDGICEAAERAHADLAPTDVSVAHGSCEDANVNRSRAAFERNPLSDKEFFPNAVDTQSSLLRLVRGGRLVGAVSFFPVHGTSMTGDNRLVSADNKGYAARHWEREIAGQDRLAPGADDLVAAFAQTNAGDMSPNLRGTPGHGPTDDEVANTRIIGTRQFEAAAALVDAPGIPLRDLDHRLVHVDLSDVAVDAGFTGDGRAHRTGPPTGGAAALAGAGFDGPALPLVREGRNLLPALVSKGLLYRVSPTLREAQAPKDVLLPGGLNRRLHLVQERVPVQLLRLGGLYLVAIPAEVTVVAGLRLRRAVAERVGADVRDVLVVGYSNAYAHYVTTPEEYDEQRYEGASTLFGRWELPALVQTVARLAAAMAAGTAVAPGPPPPTTRAGRCGERQVVDEPLPGHAFGGVVVAPDPAYTPGQRVTVVLSGTYPNNDGRRGATYWEVQRADGESWVRVADDADWETRLHWARSGRAGSRVTLTWDIPAGTRGTFRFRYLGARRLADSRVLDVTTSTRSFEVKP